MSISMFETRTMLTALEQMKPARSFLRDKFFRNVKTFESENVDVDIVKGKRRVAVYVNPLQEGNVVERIGYTTNTYKAPYIKEKMVTTAADILKRSAGESVYSPMSPEERAAEQLVKDMTELDDIITRAEEVQAAEALFTGEVTVRNGDKISFGLDNTHKITLTTTARWSETTADPMKDLRTWQRLLQQDSGVNPDTVIFGSTAYDSFIARLSAAGKQGAISDVKIALGQIDPQQMGNGVVYVGYLKELGLDMWLYNEWYLDANGTEQPMVPAKKVWMGSTRARFDRLYGAILDLKAMYAVARFPKSWETEDPSARWLMMQAAPLLAPHQVDSYLYATVQS